MKMEDMTIEELAQQGAQEGTGATIGAAAGEIMEEAAEAAQEGAGGVRLGDLVGQVITLFQVRTGEGSIDDYKDCPLNFDGSEGMAQMLRGFSGFIGADFLRSAVLDVVIGFWKWTSKKGA